MPSGFTYPPEDAPEEYKAGYLDGCESGLSVYGNDVYKAIYSFKQDIEMMKNRTYYKAWNDALNFCRSRANRALTDGAMDLGGFGIYDLRNRKVIEGGGMGLGQGGINTPGWHGDPFAGGVPGWNDNYFQGGSGDIFGFGSGSSDWLNRKESPDWLGRTGEYVPNTP